jgi:hypothetical protein
MSVGETTTRRKQQQGGGASAAAAAAAAAALGGGEGQRWNSSCHYCCVALLDASVRELQMKMKQGVVRLQM